MSDTGRPPPGSEPPDADARDGDRRRLYERAMPEAVKRLVERALETGVEKLSEAPENLRDFVNELRLPKEATHYVYEQIDDTKKGVYRVVAKEIRDVLEHINFADEIASVLTKLSFEINTTIRFVPNPPAQDEAEQDANATSRGEEGETKTAKRPSRIPRPKVVSKVVMKARDTLEKLADLTDEEK